MNDFDSPIVWVCFVLAFLLPPIALLSLVRISFLRAQLERSRARETLSITDVLGAAGRIAVDLIVGRSRSGLLELVLFLIGAIAMGAFIVFGFADLAKA